MRSFAPLALIVAFLAMTVIPVAVAGRGYNPHPCVQYNQITKACKTFKKGTVVTPVAHPSTPPNGTTVPPVTPPVAAPAVSSSEPTEAFCVQTLQRGETFVQANEGSFDQGGSWYDLTVGGATVSLDGHDVTLLWENGAGVIVAPNVPGVGLTCGQPYVSTDGVVADPGWLAGLEPIVR